MFPYRPDNADLRLTDKGYRYGVVSNERYQQYCATAKAFQEGITALKGIVLPLSQWKQLIPQLKTTRSDGGSTCIPFSL